MRIPKSPPTSFVQLFNTATTSPQEAVAILQKLASPEVLEFVRMANRKYLPWDKIRYYDRPNGVTVEEAWAAIQMSRATSFRPLPLSFGPLQNKAVVKFWSPPKHQELLHIIDQKAGGNIGGRFGRLADDEERYLFNSLMEEAIASSQLEGATTTREVAKRLLRSRRKPRDRAEQMIVNNYKAILEIREIQNEQLTPELMMHLQQILTQGTLDDPLAEGRFRTKDDKIAVVDTMTGEILHTPPLAESLDYRIGEVCDLANESQGEFLHPAIKAIALHFALGYIHPFVDGNGRAARALFYWYMLKSGYWMFEYLPISRIFLRGPGKYARAYLYSETDGGDLTYFIHYHLHVICRAIDELHRYIHEQQQELREVSQMLKSYHDLNHRQLDVINDSIKQPSAFYTIRDHSGKYQITKATARADLFDLVERKLFKKRRIGRQWNFEPVGRLANTVKRHHAAQRLKPTRL